MTSGPSQTERSLPCPGCGYELHGTLAVENRRCPECGRRFRKRDVKAMQVGDGTPRSLSPHELRIPGPMLLLLMLLGLGLLVAAIWWSASGAAPAPPP